jgi:O-6-methylguanine DNA methyltransferase
VHELHYITLDTVLGRVLVVATDAGLRAVAIGGGVEASIPDAPPNPSHPMTALAATALRAFFEGSDDALRLPLDVKGTPFQKAVWNALRGIPRGTTVTYAALARTLGFPAASARAVGAACAANPVALAVPCHRAVGADGGLHGYRWGLDIKRRLLEMEGALTASIPGTER